MDVPSPKLAKWGSTPGFDSVRGRRYALVTANDSLSMKRFAVVVVPKRDSKNG